MELKKFLLGDNTEKIKTFAVMTDINPTDIEKVPNGFKWYLSNLGLQYEEINRNVGTVIFILYNLAYNDAVHLASRFAQKFFFFAENTFPASIVYYEVSSGDRYIKKDFMENVTRTEVAEEFFSRCGTSEVRFDLKRSAFAEKICNSIINENYEYYLKRATDDNLIIRSRAMARRNARRK